MKKVLIIGDFGKDLDDEISLLFASAFKADLEIVGVIANLYPSKLRADIAKSTLNELLMFDVPVAVGENITDKIGINDYELDIHYLKNHNIELKGKDLLYDKLLNSNGIHIVLQSGLTDFARFYKENLNLVTNKTKSITIMGGIQVDDNGEALLSDSGFLLPDTAANNNFDMEEAEWLYNRIQREEIPFNISTKNMAYAAQLSNKFYDAIGISPIGKSLDFRQKRSFVQSYKDTFVTGEKRTLPARCTKEWFIETFTDLDTYDGPADNIFEYCSKITIYDPLNLMILVDDFNDNFLESISYNATFVTSPEGSKDLIVPTGEDGTFVYGLSPENNGFQDGKIKDAVEYISDKVITNVLEIETFKQLSVEDRVRFDIEQATSPQMKDDLTKYILEFFNEHHSEQEQIDTLKRLSLRLKKMSEEARNSDKREDAIKFDFISKKYEFYHQCALSL